MARRKGCEPSGFDARLAGERPRGRRERDGRLARSSAACCRPIATIAGCFTLTCTSPRSSWRARSVATTPSTVPNRHHARRSRAAKGIPLVGPRQGVHAVLVGFWEGFQAVQQVATTPMRAPERSSQPLETHPVRERSSGLSRPRASYRASKEPRGPNPKIGAPIARLRGREPVGLTLDSLHKKAAPEGG